MWYMRDPDRVLYAESEDGVTWHRPELGLVENDGRTRNNALPIRLHSPSVIHDPTDSDSGRRYKMLGVSHSPESRGYCTAHSADGLNWQLYDTNPSDRRRHLLPCPGPRNRRLLRFPQAVRHLPRP